MNNIRNFSIIAHIDHGKSTLADRMLELTGTIEKRRMREQVLDSMELERERGITIKMQPVRMFWEHSYTMTREHSHATISGSHLDETGQTKKYIFNLIDTPGHIDFSYEVSRALKAVDGAVLLVDATQGVQAQTLTTLEMAKELGLVIIPVLSKIDAAHARIKEVKEEIATLLSCSKNEILLTSGKTGEGVEELLAAIVKRVPAPTSELSEKDAFRGLIFDFEYSNHRGVIVYTRIFDGTVQKGNELVFRAANERFTVLEVGVFTPEQKEVNHLSAGEIGYIVTGIKKPGIASVGDTLVFVRSSVPTLQGYLKPVPVVWAALYPESQDDFLSLKQALERLRLGDASFSYEEEAAGSLGRGFRCGFLGMLHLEIITERLRREFQLSLVVTSPSVTYKICFREDKTETVYTPSRFPDHGVAEKILEPWISVRIIMPNEYMSTVIQLLFDYEATVGNSETFGDGRITVTASMPLRELMRGFFDRLKSVSSGFASLSYRLIDERPADVVRLDILVAEELVPAFSRIVSARRVNEEAKNMVKRLHSILPRQLFITKIQGRALGRIIASKTIPALRKDVTGHLYGGDITRKMKLREKQKKGKKRMQAHARVIIPQNVFLKMLRDD